MTGKGRPPARNGAGRYRARPERPVQCVDTSAAADARHSFGGGVFGRNSHSGSIAQCQHSGRRALQT